MARRLGRCWTNPLLGVLAICLAGDKTCGMQGKSNRERKMLDAAAFCRGLVEEGSFYASSLITAMSCSGKRTSRTCSPSDRRAAPRPLRR